MSDSVSSAHTFLHVGPFLINLNKVVRISCTSNENDPDQRAFVFICTDGAEISTGFMNTEAYNTNFAHLQDLLLVGKNQRFAHLEAPDLPAAGKRVSHL